MDLTPNPLEDNIEINPESKLYVCNLCPKKYAIVMRFNRHIKDHKNGKITAKETWIEKQDLNCEFCGKSGFRSKKRHESTHKMPEKKKCPYCEKKFLHDTNLLKHQEIHTSETNKCNFCGKWFKALSNLRTHELIHTDEKPFSCPLCPKRFNQAWNLKLHNSVHSVETPNPCSKCDKCFVSNAHLKRHEKSHHQAQTKKKQELKCNVCSYVTHVKHSLYTHKVTHQAKSQTILFKCDQCDLESKSESAMNNHKNIVHNGQKKFICEQCDFKTGYGCSLKGHIEDVHEKIRANCTICSWKGARIYLAKHKREVHFSQKKDNFKCDICSNEYLRNEHLKKHVNRDHRGLRYSCPNCEHKATTTGGLKVHISSKHEGTRYPCKQCSHKAYCKSSLIKHMNVIHLNIKTNICNICEFKASTKSNLKMHEKHYHGHLSD